MRGKEVFHETVARLGAQKAAIRCSDMRRALMRLGFEVRDAAKPGHKVFSHDGIADFLGGGYTCGHGKNPEIKAVYVSNVLSILHKYESDIIQFLESA